MVRRGPDLLISNSGRIPLLHKQKPQVPPEVFVLRQEVRYDIISAKEDGMGGTSYVSQRTV